MVHHGSGDHNGTRTTEATQCVQKVPFSGLSWSGMANTAAAMEKR
jgi:hypothetical protein